MSGALTEEIRQTNCLVTEGLRRLYRLKIGERIYDLEFTTPHRFTIGGETIETSVWGELLKEVVSILLEMFPDKESLLFSFSTDWSKASMFSRTKRTNFLKVREGLYINANHTSLHSCWLLYDLLALFGVKPETCSFLIHRMPKAEPIPVRDAVRADIKASLLDFLIWKKLLPAEKAEKQIRNLDFLNKKFANARSNSGYDDLFLFDDLKLFSSVKSKFISYLKNEVFPTEPKKIDICRRCLDYMTDFLPTYEY